MISKNGKFRNLYKFFLITFAWTWLLQVPRLLASAGWIDLPGWLSSTLGYLAVFGPSITGFTLTGLQSGKIGMRTLWRRGWKMEGRKIWLLPAVLLMPLCGLVTLGLMLVLQKPILWEHALPPFMIVPFGLLIWLLQALPEEYGWRGYALGRLQNHFGALTASLILGVIWSLWHLPLHFIPGTTQAAIPFGEYAIQTIVLSIVYTWLFNHTNGSVLITVLFHVSGNLTAALIPTWTTQFGRWLGLLPLIVIAVVIGLTRNLDSSGLFTEQESELALEEVKT